MQRGGPFWGKGGKCVVFNRLGREVLSEERVKVQVVRQ